MKRFISILLVVMLAAALIVASTVTASAKKSKSQQYLKLIHPTERASEDQFVCWVIPYDDIFEQGKQYTFFANVMFGDDIEPNGGCAYVNVYSYSSFDAAMSTNFDYLFAFMDFAIANAQTHPEPNKWTEYTYTFDPSINLRGAQGDKCEAVWISAGFWMATGTLSVLDLGVKDPETNEILYYRDFQDGIDLSEPNFRYSADMEADNKGVYWDLVGKGEDAPAESSEPEPDPVESSEPEPNPVESSETEPDPVESSEPEPEPVESSDEPAPVESSEEPAPVESSEEPAPSQAEPVSEPTSEAPAANNGPGPVLWIILGAVAVAVVVAVVLILILRKKKA